jgi:hypothetical protein
VRLARGGTWEVVRPRNSHVGRRYELCSAHAATVARGVRGGRRGSPGSRAPLLALGRRTPQLLKRRRAHARDVLPTAYRHPELPPVAQSCARGMGRMTMRPSRRCLRTPRQTLPTHSVDTCIKVGSRRPRTRRRRAVLPLTGAVARGGPWARRSNVTYLAPSLVTVWTMQRHR